MWYPVKNPFWVHWCFPNLHWKLPKTDPPQLYLTFDDGPIPEVTPWVLKQLAVYDAKATFFCIGRNIKRHPDVYKQLIAAGHQIGNHTYNHLNGWKHKCEEYLLNTEACAELVDSKLFRPPYGRLRNQQSRQLLKKGYKIIMWDVIAGDFDQKLEPKKCLDNILKHCNNGSILVLHDSLKAWPRLEYALPRLLAHFHQKGFQFSKLPDIL